MCLGQDAVEPLLTLSNEAVCGLVEVDSRTWEPDTPGVDFCFIDAGHTYECVKNDTEKALKVIIEA